MATNKIYLATANAGKLRELQVKLPELDLVVVPDYQQVPETAGSFVENALIKARAMSARQSAPALADDTGLLVRALGDAPGLYSSRYAGDDADDAANRALLLENMQGITDRSAYFYCVLVLVRDPDDPCPLIGEAHWDGVIGTSEQGKYGFGYDSIFYPAMHNCSIAQMHPALKNSVGHRARAASFLCWQIERRAPELFKSKQ